MTTKETTCAIIHPLTLEELKSNISHGVQFPSSGVYLEFQNDWIVDPEIKYSYGIYDWVLNQHFRPDQTIIIQSFGIAKGMYLHDRVDVSPRYVSIIISADSIEVKIEITNRCVSTTKDGIMIVKDCSNNQTSRWMRINKNNNVQWSRVQTTTYSLSDGYKENEYPDDPKAFYRQTLELIDYNDFLQSQFFNSVRSKDLSAFEEHCFKCSLVTFKQIAESMSSIPPAFVSIWNAAVRYYKSSNEHEDKKDLHVRVLSTIEKICAQWKLDNPINH